MSGVVAHCLAQASDRDAEALRKQLLAWNASIGHPFPAVERRRIGALPSLGEHTHSLLAQVATC